MPRTFGKLLCTIWDDDDWRGLTSDAKVLYSAFMSQPDITAAGVLALTERRWRAYFGGNLSAVTNALDELVERRFVVVDEDTSEVWVRTFIKHDGRLENDNLRKSIHRAIVEIRSDVIRKACQKQYPDIPPGGTPFERPSNATSREVELLEPAASSQQPEPSTPNQQPAAPPGDAYDRLLDYAELAAAAAAIDLLIEHKIATGEATRPGAFRRAMPRRLMDEHAPAMNAYLHAHADVTAADLAQHVLGLSQIDLFRIGAA
jgi:hypothetical protein